MRRKILTIFLLILLFCSLTTNVFAAEQEYEIDSVDFDIVLHSTGSATVTETWRVDYEEGKFSRFFKNIYRDLPKDEDFDIQFQTVLVDGVPCTLTDDTDSRKDYTYAIIDSYDKTRYEIYIHSEDEKREFTITYNLYGVIKEVDNDYYLFEFRLLPLGFEKGIEKATVRIELPNGSCDFTDVDINQGKIGRSGDVATAKANDIDGLYKVSVRFEGDDIIAIPINSETEGDGDWSPLIPAVMVFAFIGLCIIIPLTCEKQQEKKLKAELEANPHLFTTLYQKWVPRYFTPAEFSWLLTRNRCLSYMVHLAELRHRNIIMFDEGYEYITFPKYYGTDSVLKILDESRLYALKKKMETPEDQYYWYLPVSHLEKFFVSNKGFDMLRRDIYQPLTKKKNIKDKTLIKDIKKMKAIAQLLNKTNTMPFISFATIVAQYDNSTHYIPYYCFQKASTCHDDETEDMSIILTGIALAAYATHIDSSNHGTSCSSCSSCGGGCGGCGGCGGSD